MVIDGVPAEPDMKKLMEKWPEDKLTVGLVLTYDELEAVLNTEGDCSKDKGTRFRYILMKWRKFLEESCSILLGPERGVGLKVLSADGRVDVAGGYLRSAYRRARRANTVAADVPRNELDQETAHRLDHIHMLSASILSHNRRMLSSSKRRVADVTALLDHKKVSERSDK